MSKKPGLIGGIFTAVFILAVVFVAIFCVERVPAGYVGVKYSPKGIEEEYVGTGWHFVSPTTKIKEFTISQEQLNIYEDDDFNVSTSDNATIKISLEMSYHFLEDKVVPTYKKFRGMDGEDIVERRVRSVLESKVSEVTYKYGMMDIYSGNRAQINKDIQEYLNTIFPNEYGIEVDSATIVDVHPDKKLKESIDNRVKALQEKQQAEAEQEKVKVEAETKKIKAQNEADIKILEAEAEAKANKIIAESITQPLIDMELAEARKKHGWISSTGVSTVVKE